MSSPTVNPKAAAEPGSRGVNPGRKMLARATTTTRNTWTRRVRRGGAVPSRGVSPTRTRDTLRRSDWNRLDAITSGNARAMLRLQMIKVRDGFEFRDPPGQFPDKWQAVCLQLRFLKHVEIRMLCNHLGAWIRPNSGVPGSLFLQYSALRQYLAQTCQVCRSGVQWTRVWDRSGGGVSSV